MPGSSKCAGTRTVSATGVMALSESLFQACCSWQSEGLFGQSFSVAPPIQAHRGLPCLGSYSVDRHIRHLKGPPGWGPICSSVCQAFDGPASLFFSCRCWHVGGQRLRWQWRLHPLWHSAVSPCFHGFLAFLHRHFPPQSPPSHALHPSLCSQQQPLPWDCSTRLKLQLPATAPSRGPAPVRGMYGCSKDCLILIPFMLSQISCFPLSLKCFSSDLHNCPDVFPHPLRAGLLLLTLLFFPLVPSSYRVLCGSVYSFPLVRYSCLLSLVSCRHSCVWRCILMYPWRETYSTSTYSSAISFSS